MLTRGLHVFLVISFVSSWLAAMQRMRHHVGGRHGAKLKRTVREPAGRLDSPKNHWRRVFKRYGTPSFATSFRRLYETCTGDVFN